jgi:hypothetical protein
VVSIPTAVNRPGSSRASRRTEGDLTYPLKNGIVVNWSEYEQLMDECFHECVAFPLILLVPQLRCLISTQECSGSAYWRGSFRKTMTQQVVINYSWLHIHIARPRRWQQRLNDPHRTRLAVQKASCG